MLVDKTINSQFCKNNNKPIVQKFINASVAIISPKNVENVSKKVIVAFM